MSPRCVFFGLPGRKSIKIWSQQHLQNHIKKINYPNVSKTSLLKRCLGDMTSSLMWSACRVFPLPQLRRIASCLPCNGVPITPQSCHSETRQHSSEHGKLTWTLTCRCLNLEETSARPPPHSRLSARERSASRVLPWSLSIRTHTGWHTQNPLLLTDWQELHGVQLHRLCFKPSTTDWQPAESRVLAETHALFTNQQGFAKLIMGRAWTTLKPPGMELGI